MLPPPLEVAFRNKADPFDHVRQISQLSQTGSIHSFFLEVDRLNIVAQLHQDALWKILKANLRPTLRTALATLRPKPTNYLEWRQAALDIGAELDAKHSSCSTNPTQPKKRSHDRNDKTAASKSTK